MIGEVVTGEESCRGRQGALIESEREVGGDVVAVCGRRSSCMQEVPT